MISKSFCICSFQAVHSGTAHNFKITRLTELTTYEFRIYASNDAGSGPYSDTYSFTTTKAPPTPPKGKKAITTNCFCLSMNYEG